MLVDLTKHAFWPPNHRKYFHFTLGYPQNIPPSAWGLLEVCLKFACVGMGRVKTRPEIWPDPRVFWPTRPDPNNFSKDPSQPVVIFS